MEDVLGFCALALTTLMTLGGVAWLCCSIVERVAQTRRRLKDAKYDALLRENRRLKGFLREAEEKNSLLKSRLRRIRYPERTGRKSTVGRRAA